MGVAYPLPQWEGEGFASTFQTSGLKRLEQLGLWEPGRVVQRKCVGDREARRCVLPKPQSPQVCPPLRPCWPPQLPVNLVYLLLCSPCGNTFLSFSPSRNRQGHVLMPSLPMERPHLSSLQGQFQGLSFPVLKPQGRADGHLEAPSDPCSQ